MAPYSSAGAKNEIADDGHFLQKKLLPFILQKNSFCSFYKTEWNIDYKTLVKTSTFIVMASITNL